MIEEAAGTRMYESKRLSAQKTIQKKDNKLREIDAVRCGSWDSMWSRCMCVYLCYVLVPRNTFFLPWDTHSSWMLW